MFKVLARSLAMAVHPVSLFCMAGMVSFLLENKNLILFLLHLSALLIFNTPRSTVCSMKSPKGVPSFNDWFKESCSFFLFLGISFFY